MSLEQALRRTLELSAGTAGLAHLLAQRHALRATSEARAAARSACNLAVKLRRQHAAPTAWRAWFDGSAKPNPGRCGIGGLLQGPAGERIEISEPAGYGNSSEAEYRALIALLQAAVRHGSHHLTIYGDSQVVIDDVTGPDCDSALALRYYRREAQALLAQLSEVTMRWIPRHKNHDADALSQRAAALPALETSDDNHPD
jgi:ribonuclease HI